MHYIRFCLLAAISVLIISSCNKVPEHARYIPKDAVAVLGINTKQLGKKIAWNMLTGSKLLDEMGDNVPFKDALKDAEHAGIKTSTTFYIYMKPDARFQGANKVTALVPLEDADKWEKYLKKTMPSATITKDKNHKQADLGFGVYAGWNDELLVFVNSFDMQKYIADSVTDSANTTPVTDVNEMSAEIDGILNNPKENALTANKHFASLEQSSHDISLWLNYESMLNQYMGKSAAMLSGLNFAGGITKDAAMAAGIDFEKGRIKGNLLYYSSPEIRGIMQSISKDKADKDMIDRLPSENLDMLMAMHISPAGIKAMIEKMGILGFINIALAEEGFDATYILDAFTGDMAFSVNDFVLKQEKASADTASETGTEKDFTYDASANYLYAIKIGKKANFDKLLQYAINKEILEQRSSGVYSLMGDTSGRVICVNDKYCLVTNKANCTVDYVSGKFKTQKLSENAKAVYGHPFGFYFDIQQMIKSIDPAFISTNATGVAMVSESKKLLNNVSFYGGEVKNDAMEYNMYVNFMNKEENSLVQMMNFAIKMNGLSNTQAK